MNPIKEQIKKEAAMALFKAGIKWESLNNDNHWRINEIDFWPTTDKWLCPLTGETEYGVENLINYIQAKTPKKGIRRLSIGQMFTIAARVRPTNLLMVCGALHKEIYGV